MHITFIISSLTSGGAERVITQLANYFVERGYTVSLITLAAPAAAPFYPLSDKIKLVQLNLLMEAHSLPRRLCAILKRLWCIRATIRTLNPDRIISFIDIMNITVLLAMIGRSDPVIVSERIDPTHHPIPDFYKWLRLKFYPRAKAVVVQTTASRAYFPDHIQALIQIIPNAVPPCPEHRQVNHTTDRSFQFISVGRLSPQKDHETLIRAFARIVDAYPSSHTPMHIPKLTIYGEGDLKLHLLSLIQSLNMTDHISLPGTTPHLSTALIAADVFVFPSRYEGFPNALCEAMAVGLPVIASNCSGNIDVVRDEIDGLLFPAGDVEVLVSLMTDLMNNPKKRQQLSAHAITLSERFDANSIMKQWEDIMQRSQ